MYKFNSIKEAIQDIKDGKMVIVIDDPSRENEGDLVMAAEMVTGDDINFMAKHAKGLICTPCREDILNKLNISPMVSNNTDTYETAFTVSIDHINTTTGISAYERAETISMLLDENSKASDFRRPGHIFPLKAKENGVLDRLGHTEASVDLAELAGFKGIAVICEIMKDDGHMARVPDLIEYSKKHNIKIITIKDLVEYRKQNENHVSKVAQAKMPTKYGDFEMFGFINNITKEHHVALVKGDITTNEPVLTRIHSECLTGDALGSSRCDCGEQYDEAMKRIVHEGRGILLYLRQEGRGIGLINKIKAYELQDKGYDTVEANIELGFPADLRDYSVAAHILKTLNVKDINLMTNNPDKVHGVEKYGINVSNRVPIIMPMKKTNEFYLNTKVLKMNHIL